MGTHPIFESDFDCLTEKKNCRYVEVKLGPFSLDQSVVTRKNNRAGGKCQRCWRGFRYGSSWSECWLENQDIRQQSESEKLGNVEFGKTRYWLGSWTNTQKTNDECYTSRQKR